MAPIRVLVVDDSAFMRKVIANLLESDPGFKVVGTASNGVEALQRVEALAPDVVTLDVEMPKMDGLTALKEMVGRHRARVVMVSSLTQEGAETTIRALAAGAVDFVPKPSGSVSLDMHRVGDDLRRKVKAAAQARVRVPSRVGPPPADPPAPGSHERPASGNRSRRVVVIGCSTGGPGALHEVIPRLPGDLGAAVLIVQHMPPGFTRSLAQRLDELSAIRVREAQPGDLLTDNTAFVAPGGYHMTVDGEGRIALDQEPPLHGVRPAVDRTLVSVAQRYGRAALGVIMTGMGYDGAKGIAELKRTGGRAIAEAESTCVVYGMPRVVVEMGHADRVAPLAEIPKAILELMPA